MRLANLWVVSALDKRLHEMRFERAEIEAGKALGVTINGKYQPEAVVDAVRPVMLVILDTAIAEVETQLRGLGVDLSPDTHG